MAFSIAGSTRRLNEHDVGGAPPGLEFAVEGDTTDVIDSHDASAPNKAEHEFRVKPSNKMVALAGFEMSSLAHRRGRST